MLKNKVKVIFKIYFKNLKSKLKIFQIQKNIYYKIIKNSF